MQLVAQCGEWVEGILAWELFLERGRASPSSLASVASSRTVRDIGDNKVVTMGGIDCVLLYSFAHASQ